MAYRKSTLRKMDTNTRKLARLINDLDSALTRLKNFMPTVERMELDSNALYSRLSTYEKKVFNQEHLPPEPASLFPEQHEQVQQITLAELNPMCEACAKSCKDGINAEFPDSCTQFAAKESPEQHE